MRTTPASTRTSPIPPSRAVPAAADHADLRRPRVDRWLVEDQRFVHLRPDVLSYETEPLAEDVTVAGAIVAHLFASTTGTDGDWIVKLIDVYPEDDPEDARLPAHDRRRGLPRPLPQELREARADRARPRSRNTRSTCTGTITASRRGTRSWCRSRAPGSP